LLTPIHEGLVVGEKGFELLSVNRDPFGHDYQTWPLIAMVVFERFREHYELGRCTPILRIER
jgi:hypothetical protein